MKKKKFFIGLIILLAIAVIGGMVAFRTQPIIAENKTYLMHVESGSGNILNPGFNLWPQGPDDSYATETYIIITEEQEQAVLDVLSRYEKRLSFEDIGLVLLQEVFPSLYASVKAEIPPWLEAQIIFYDTTWNNGDVFNIVLGNGHVQQRQDYTFHPPYYTIENEEELYTELSELLNLKALLSSK